MPRISQLPQHLTLTGSEVFPADQGPDTVQLDLASLTSYISGHVTAAIGPLTGEVTTPSTGGTITTINKGISPKWTAKHNFSAGFQVLMDVNPPVATQIPNAIYIAQNFPATTLTGPQVYNRAVIVDQYQCPFVYGWLFQYLINGGGGNRAGLAVQLDMYGTPHSPPGEVNTVTAFFNASVMPGVNAGGTNLFALNSQAVAYPGVTNLPQIQVNEFDLSIAGDVTSVDHAHCSAFCYTNAADVNNPTNTRRANVQTAACVFYSETDTAGFSDLFIIGDVSGANQSPFGPIGARGGSIMRIVQGPSINTSIKYGIDLTNSTALGDDSTGFAFGSPGGFIVDWSGDLAARTLTAQFGIGVTGGDLNVTGNVLATGRVQGSEFDSAIAGGGRIIFPTANLMEFLFGSTVIAAFDSVGNVNFAGPISTPGNISPAVDLTYDLGIGTPGSYKRWLHIYANQSIMRGAGAGFFAFDRITDDFYAAFSRSNGIGQINDSNAGVVLQWTKGASLITQIGGTVNPIANATQDFGSVSLMWNNAWFSGQCQSGFFRASFGYLFSQLATPGAGNVGNISRITDGPSGLAMGASVTAGLGTTPYLVWSNGANWTVIGK